MASMGRKVRENWSVIFAGSVVAYLALTTVNARSLIPDVSWPGQSVSIPSIPSVPTIIRPGETTTTSPSSAVGNLSFEVTALRIRQTDSGTFQARVTLDITNNGTSTVRFRPDQVTLSRNGGPPIGPTDDHLRTMDVSPHISQLTPITFDVNATPGARYTLMYQGRTLFDGFPS